MSYDRSDHDDPYQNRTLEMKKLIQAVFIAAAALGMMPTAVSAGDDIDEVLKSLKKVMPNLSRGDVSSSPVDGIYEVNRGMSYFYVTSDGRYVFSGDLVDIRSGQSITENNRKSMRLQELGRLKDQDMITFRAKEEKFEVTVFTDIDCGYCRKLHREMADYNDAGITVHYLFYPRSGPNTPSFKKAEAVWCSGNRNVAMTTAKQGGDVKAESCPNPVRRQYEAGQALGVRGTPAIVLPDGGLQPGYLPAERMLAVLKES